MHYKEIEVIAEIGEDYHPKRTQIPNRYQKQAMCLTGLTTPRTITEEKVVRAKAKKLKNSERKRDRSRSKQIIREIDWTKNEANKYRN